MNGSDVYLPKEYKDTSLITLAFYHINHDMQKISTSLSKLIKLYFKINFLNDLQKIECCDSLNF